MNTFKLICRLVLFIILGCIGIMFHEHSLSALQCLLLLCILAELEDNHRRT